MSNFQPLEVVGRGSKTQHPVAENLNNLTLFWLWYITLEYLTLKPQVPIITAVSFLNIFNSTLPISFEN